MFWKLVFWVVLTKILVSLFIIYGPVGLMPDEAQYWTWSKDLSYGYYSKPPGIAWQIAAGCFFFGDTEFGVRFVSQLLSVGLSISLFYLAKACRLSDMQAFWAALAFSVSPLGVLSGFFATTDCAYVFFWTLAALLFLRKSSFLLIGLVIGIGALWKWPIYAIWLPILCFSSFKKVFPGFLISLLGLIPSLIWNLHHDFATFQHVFRSIDVSHPEARGNPLEFIGAQIMLASPVFFALAILAALRLYKTSDPLRFCAAVFASFLGAVFVASFFGKVQGNWAVAAYPTAFVLIAAMGGFERLVKIGVGVSVALVVIAFSLSYTNIPLRRNIWKEGLGWDNLSSALSSSGYNPDTHILFSDRYQMTSIASFYGPEQRRAHFLNIHALRKNQFSYWPSIQPGSSGYFFEAVIGKDPESAAVHLKRSLEPYFAHIEQLLPVPLWGTEKVAIFLYCDTYNGKMPPERNLY